MQHRILLRLCWLLLAFALAGCAGRMSRPALDGGSPPPPATESPDFRMIVLPDSQYYASQRGPVGEPAHPLRELFESQISYIVAQKDTLNIRFVLHVGDLTNIFNQYPDDSEDMQFNRVQFDRLRAAGIPFAVTMGNHDVAFGASASRDSTVFNQAFPISYFNQTANFVAAFDETKSDNLCLKFVVGGRTYAVFVFEPAPRLEVLAWADALLAQHRDWQGIMLTHEYVSATNTWTDETNPAFLKRMYPVLGANDCNGKCIYDNFISKHPNMLLTFNGHDVTSQAGDAGLLVSSYPSGSNVYQMLANYQAMPPTHGEGFLRIVAVWPSAGQIRVKTYSPYRNRWLTDEKNQFEINGVRYITSTQ